MSELPAEEVQWRVRTLRTVLGITRAGPFMYTASPQNFEESIRHSLLPKTVASLAEGDIFVHYHRGGITRVTPVAFPAFWGHGQYYCTVFDHSFSWFVMTDDNSEDLDRAVLIRRS